MKKVGIICEGSIGGEDQQVLEHLAGRICPGATLLIRPLGNKPQLIANCGEVAQALFASGCNRVLIVWDIFPRWDRPDGEQQDVADINTTLVAAGLANHPCLYLVPIHKELEAWLLADGSALSRVLSRPARPVRISDTRNAEHNPDPKARLGRIFAEHGRNYNVKTDAISIVNEIPQNFGVLGNQKTFKNFGRSLTQPCTQI